MTTRIQQQERFCLIVRQGNRDSGIGEGLA